MVRQMEHVRLSQARKAKENNLQSTYKQLKFPISFKTVRTNITLFCFAEIYICS